MAEQPAELDSIHAGLKASLSLREIYLVDDIDNDTLAWMLRTMRAFEYVGSGPIHIYLHTDGGDEVAMMALHDVITTSPCKVEVVGIGEIVSAGVLILACADTRIVTPSTTLMCHETTYSSLGHLSGRALAARGAYVKWMFDRSCSLLDSYSNKTAAWWAKQMKSGEYWTYGAEEIVELGLADSVVERRTR